MAFGNVNVPGSLSRKQDKLTGLPGQVVGFDGMGLAHAVRGWSNQNLLINWDFRNPVNRNGRTEYTGTGYTIDMWSVLNFALGVSLGEGGLTIQSPAPSYGVINQRIPGLSSLLGKTLTASILYDDCELATVTYTLPNTLPDGSIDSTNAIFTGGSVDIYANKSDQTADVLNFRIIITGGPVTIKAVKLELGSVQTIAHQDADGSWVLNDPPNYALQYALCSLYSPSTGGWIGYQHSNPNLLDNWYFADPVNQRGKTEYTVAGYTIDRYFQGTDITTTIHDGYISIYISPSGSAYSTFRQQLCDVEHLNGSTVTVSILCKSESDATIALYNTSKNLYLTAATIHETQDFELVSFTKTIPPNTFDPGNLMGVLIYPSKFGVQAEGKIDVIAVKAEIGSQQTLAHQDADGNWVLNDPPPNKALELVKCQRYYYTIEDLDVLLAEKGQNNKIFCSSVTFPEMRATPAVVIEKSESGKVGIVHGTRYLVEGDVEVSSRTTANKFSLQLPLNNNSGLLGAVATIYRVILDANL